MASEIDIRREGNAFARLYPNLTDQELEQAEENFARYLDVAIRIWHRIEADPRARQRLHELTADHSRRYDENHRSAPPVSSFPL